MEPQSLFYDWLYVSAVTQPQNEPLLGEIMTYSAFTDIEFNPEKSVSCQAKVDGVATRPETIRARTDCDREPDEFSRPVYWTVKSQQPGQTPLF